MAKNNEREFVEHLNDSKIIRVKVDEEMKRSFIEYAMAVNVSRAIPDVRDGLKPVHRRILFSMNELGLTNDKPFRKCALIVGDVLGKYHPHGDSSVYDALVRLAQDFSIRYPLVDGHGNFGSVDGHKAAAYRYTEARLAKMANEMLRDIDKETVDYYPNFDETRMQPVVLPARFPNLLVNGSDGIAVGMATSIPPHNLCEVIDGTVALLDNPDLDIEDLISIIPAPDYPTGAIVLGGSAIRQAYRTGRGGAIIRAKAEIEESANGKSEIIVTEIPYQVNKASLIKSIADLVKDKKIEGITDVREESDREGIRIVVEVRRDANPQVVLNTLYKQTQLQVSNSMILLCLVDGEPRVLNLKQILEYYIQHQESVILRRTQYDLAKAEEREHIVSGLVIAQENIDEVIAIIKRSSDKAEATANLIERFGFSERQTNAILEMPLRRLTNLEAGKLREELAQLEADILRYRAILGDMNMVNDIIRTELLEIKEKYGTPRLSQLSYDSSDINLADLIAREDIVISMTHFGYIKRMPVSEYNNQHRGGKGIQGHKPKEDDFVENMFITHTHDPLMFFTNKGKVYRMMGYDIPEAQRMARGRAIVNLLNLGPDEKVTALLRCPEGQKGYLMLATKQGKIKKTNLTEFDSIRTSGKIAISLLEEDELVGAAITTGEEDIILAATSGKCIRFAEADVRDMGRTAQGVRSMKLGEGEYIVDMAVIKEDCEVLTVSENGYGKRSSQDDFRCQGRAGMGVKAGTFTEETGCLAGLKVLPPDTDVMLIADNGVIIRVDGGEIRHVSRASKGVIVMRLKGKSKVICVALTPHCEEEPEGEEAVEGEAPAEAVTQETPSAAPVADAFDDKLEDDRQEEGSAGDDGDL